MCQACEAVIAPQLVPGRELHTQRGFEFTIIGRDDDRVDFEIASSGSAGHFHFSHVVACFHWMAVAGHDVEGVGGAGLTVRGLVGADGHLVRCEGCERAPAYIWGVLAALPGVQRDRSRLRRQVQAQA